MTAEQSPAYPRGLSVAWVSDAEHGRIPLDPTALTAAREAMDEWALRLTGRDLGTIHAGEIAAITVTSYLAALTGPSVTPNTTNQPATGDTP